MTYLVTSLVFQRPDSPQLGWQFTAPEANIIAWFPAVQTQTQQFKVRRHALLDLYRHVRPEQEIAYIQAFLETLPTFTYPAMGQLIDSYRAGDSPKFDLRYHVELSRYGPASYLIGAGVVDVVAPIALDGLLTLLVGT